MTCSKCGCDCQKDRIVIVTGVDSMSTKLAEVFREAQLLNYVVGVPPMAGVQADIALLDELHSRDVHRKFMIKNYDPDPIDYTYLDVPNEFIPDPENGNYGKRMKKGKRNKDYHNRPSIWLNA